jgi:N-acetylglucosaminyldiphosphoundecaprenol N-acetyl-beta-D-mannosaminyltransferase
LVLSTTSRREGNTVNTQLLTAEKNTADSCPEGWPRRVPLFGIELDAVNMAEAVSLLLQWIAAPQRECRFVVTPNVDHVVLLQENAALRAAYADASLVVADGWPIVTASRWLGQPLPERVAGSDLIPYLFAAQRSGPALKTYLLGAAPGVALRAAERIHARWPRVQVVGCDSPPPGFEYCSARSKDILERIAAAEPDLLIIGLGAPKQELWVHAHQERITTKVAVCAGATIDFLAGERRRAPHWMQRCRLEWLHRAASEPRRLARRYLRDAALFPPLVWHEWWRRFRAARKL